MEDNRQIYAFIKTVSMDNAIREFSLAQPSWVISHIPCSANMVRKRTRDFCGAFIFSLVYFSIFWGRF